MQAKEEKAEQTKVKTESESEQARMSTWSRPFSKELSLTGSRGKQPNICDEVSHNQTNEELIRQRIRDI